MKVLHVVPGIGVNSGGPSRSSQGLVAALCKAGVDAWIYSFDNVNPWILGVRRVELEQGRRAVAAEELKRFDIVHIHGIWDVRLHDVAVMCHKVGVPYVISPRGMLEPWSLKQKWLKKRIARWLYQDRDLRLAAALHATAESEAEQFRKLGFKNKIIVSPNGVNVPEGDFGTQVVSRHANLAKSDVATTARTALSPQSAFCQGSSGRALFVSRMHPKKGVLELVESWARVKAGSRGLDGWSCELVYTMNSEEERTYEQKVKDRILSLGMSYRDKKGIIHSTTATSHFDFILTGPLDDEKKWDAYARADLFVLPTYSENFGIVVAEALWAGVPVITTKGTPWAELEGASFQSHNSRCGWWIDLPPAEYEARNKAEQWAALDDALRTATMASFCDLEELGRNGRTLIQKRYTWGAVCEQMVRGYEGIIRDW